jgi:hypothetical protein
MLKFSLDIVGTWISTSYLYSFAINKRRGYSVALYYFSVWSDKEFKITFFRLMNKHAAC